MSLSLGHFGSGVASYFLFLRWIFFLNLWMFLLVAVFVVVPRMMFRPGDVTSVDDLSMESEIYATVSPNVTELANVTECSLRYQVNVSHTDAGQLVLDFLQGTVRPEVT